MKKNANKQAKKRLALFARLANIEQLGTLKDWEKLQLVDETREAGFSWVHLQPTLKEKQGDGSRTWTFREGKRITSLALRYSPEIADSWGISAPLPFEWQALFEAHEQCVPVLRDLLAGKEVENWGFFLDPTYLRVDLPTGCVLRRKRNTGFELLTAFEQALQHDPFPFRRCPVLECGQVFVPGKNQKFCSPSCLTQGTTSRRKDERREYMRAYMANRRREARSGKKQPTR